MKMVIVRGLQRRPQGQTLIDTRKDEEGRGRNEGGHTPSRGMLDGSESTSLPGAVCPSEGRRSHSSDVRSPSPGLCPRPRGPPEPGAEQFCHLPPSRLRTARWRREEGLASSCLFPVAVTVTRSDS